MASRVEKYLAHLDRLSGGREPRFFPVESTKQGLRGVTEIVYDNLPDGLLTALTYGLSLAEHPDWQHGSPELCLLRMRTREGMAVARAEGKLKGKQPKLTARQQTHLVQQHQSGEHTIADLAELFSVSRATVYRVLERHQNAATPSTPGGQ
ncbi:helix-turn-helix domain-containing protein [Streptomyces sp. NRRL S-87]|uniref:helix-turn-helix domain-containing protein n=1 Tax=Streptomyces sp. NRRL S-87 TaxID=1463920 RepID=UPI0019014F1E|nr:helix-turn-helix domain-containing protein [Streptomyces sp. NRRL S-87]